MYAYIVAFRNKFIPHYEGSFRLFISRYIYVHLYIENLLQNIASYLG